MQVLKTVSHRPGEITPYAVTSQPPPWSRKKKGGGQHSQTETAPPERVETLVKPGRGGAGQERAAPSEAPDSLNRGLCELQFGWTQPAGRVVGGGGAEEEGGWGGVGGSKTDTGLCLSWSPARSALYFRRSTAPRLSRHKGRPVCGGP